MQDSLHLLRVWLLFVMKEILVNYPLYAITHSHDTAFILDGVWKIPLRCGLSLITNVMRIKLEIYPHIVHISRCDAHVTLSHMFDEVESNAA